MIDQEGQGDEQRQDNERPGNQPGRGENTETIEEVVDGFQQKLIDQPVADFLADLIVLVEGTDEELEDQQRDKISQRLVQVESADLIRAGERRSPEDEDAGEVEKRKKAADQKVPAVDEVALQPDEKGVPVFVEGGEHEAGSSE